MGWACLVIVWEIYWLSLMFWTLWTGQNQCQGTMLNVTNHIKELSIKGPFGNNLFSWNWKLFAKSVKKKEKKKKTKQKQKASWIVQWNPWIVSNSAMRPMNSIKRPGAFSWLKMVRPKF